MIQQTRFEFAADLARTREDILASRISMTRARLPQLGLEVQQNLGVFSGVGSLRAGGTKINPQADGCGSKNWRPKWTPAWS